MENINGIPIIWGDDTKLLGSVFPDISVSKVNNDFQETIAGFKNSPFGENWDKENSTENIQHDSPFPLSSLPLKTYLLDKR